uniref:EpsG family protein n=1 Tax=Agathobacter sp. TaxID=2021311 RepID=UPI0040568635
MELIGSYILYILCFLVSIYWSYKYEQKKNKSLKTKVLFWCLITLPIVFIQGFRYEVGTDYESYLSLYNGFNQGNHVFVSWYINEPLFILLCKVVYIISGGNQVAFFLVDAILINSIIFLIFDYYKEEVSLPIMYLFYYTLCFPYFLNIERQGLAVALIWYSTKYVHEKKPSKFILCILIASLFHNTAIVGCVLYFINFLEGRSGRYVKRIFIGIAALTPFIFGSSIDFLSNHVALFSKYTKFLSDGTTEKLNINFIFMLFMLVILYILRKFLKKSKIDDMWLLFLCVAQVSTYLLDSYISWGFRMSFYFEFGLIYSYSLIFSKLKYRTNKMLLLMFLITILGFYFTYKFYIQGNCEIFPFKFVFLN